jgi:hypothetical protein
VADQHEHASSGGNAGHIFDQGGLADSRFAGDEDEATTSGERSVDRLSQDGLFALSANDERNVLLPRLRWEKVVKSN